MSIALNSASGIDLAPSSGFAIAGAACGLVFETAENRRGDTAGEVEVASATSSSIGKDSDDESDGGNDEAQSSYKGPLDMMNALEEVLPMRRGISKFYNCKSKSFASLAEASSSSNIQDIAKADNAYTRKRRNLLASNYMWEKNRNRNLNLQLTSNGISKRPISASRSSLALAVRLSSFSESSTSSTSEESSSVPNSPGYGSGGGWRSYSLADLQECAVSATVNSSRFSPENQMRKN